MTVAFAIGGLIVGVIFSLVYALIYLAAGGVPAISGTIISPVSAAGMYLVGCGIGGAVVGALRELFRSKGGTAVLGILGTGPVVLSSGWLYYEGWASVDWLGFVVITVVIGAPLGFVIRKEYGMFRGPYEQPNQPM
jgi:hypothetical protein